MVYSCSGDRMTQSEKHDFLSLFLAEEPLLRAFLLSATGRLHASEDLLQNVASVAWQQWERFDRSRPFRPWAMGIARLEVLKWRQRLARSKEVLSEDAVARLAETAVEHAEALDRRRHFLQECIDALHDGQRAVLEMKYAGGMAIAAIASRVGKSVAAVEMALVRTRRALRDCIQRKDRAAGRALGDVQ